MKQNINQTKSEPAVEPVVEQVKPVAVNIEELEQRIKPYKDAAYQVLVFGDLIPSNLKKLYPVLEGKVDSAVILYANSELDIDGLMANVIDHIHVVYLPEMNIEYFAV
jgi:hypothetical protein